MRAAWSACSTRCRLFFLICGIPPRPGFRRRPPGRHPAGALARIARQRLVHPAGALLHAAGAGRLGGARLDAGDPEEPNSTSARARPACRPRSSGRCAAIVGAVLGGWLADRWMRRSDRGRIYVSAIGMALIIPAMFGVGYAPQTGLLWVAIAFLHPVRAGLGILRLQQHAHPLPDRAAGTARHRLRHHEPGEHQLRRLRRLGLRHPARPPGAAASASSASSPAPRCSRSCSCCSSSRATRNGSRSRALIFMSSTSASGIRPRDQRHPFDNDASDT